MILIRWSYQWLQSTSRTCPPQDPSYDDLASFFLQFDPATERWWKNFTVGLGWEFFLGGGGNFPTFPLPVRLLPGWHTRITKHFMLRNSGFWDGVCKGMRFNEARKMSETYAFLDDSDQDCCLDHPAINIHAWIQKTWLDKTNFWEKSCRVTFCPLVFGSLKMTWICWEHGRMECFPSITTRFTLPETNSSHLKINRKK